MADQRNKSLLIIFVKNPKLGRAKTRLAATIGDEKALAAYKFLLNHTKNITLATPVDKVVFYSHFVDNDDLWSNDRYQKHEQIEGDLGQKMLHAFDYAFKNGYTKVGIIGSDCYDLTSQILEDAFQLLESSDCVFGPALDGGYYFMGMKKMNPFLFENKEWSTGSVLSSSIADCQTHNLTHTLLPSLSDIDTEEDLRRAGIDPAQF